MRNTRVLAISIPIDLYERLKTIYMESDIRISKSKFISNIIEEYTADWEFADQLFKDRVGGKDGKDTGELNDTI